MIRDIDVQQLSCVDLDDHQHTESLEGRRDHGQEITGHDGLGMITYIRLTIVDRHAVVPAGVRACTCGRYVVRFGYQASVRIH